MFKTLLKVRLRMLFDMYLNVGKRKDGKSKSPVGMILLYVFAFAMLFIAMFGLSTGIAATTLLAGEEWVYSVILTAFGFLFAILGSVMPAKSALFEAKDNDLLLAMPIPPLTIMLSRMVALLVSALFYTGIVMIPGLIVYCGCGILGLMNVSILSIILYILTYITVSVLALVLSSGIAYLVALVSSRIRHKSAVSVFLSVGIFVAFMVVYMRFIFSVSSSEDGEELESVLTAAFAGLASSPLRLIGDAIAEGNILYFLPLFAITAGLMALLIRLLSRGTVGVLAAPDAAATAKNVYKETRGERRSPIFALFMKELRGFFSSSAYVMNGMTGTIMMAVFAILILINGETVKGVMPDLFAVLSEEEIFAAIFSDMDFTAFCDRFVMPVITALFVMLSGYVMTASSISLEAKTLPILMSLPVRPYHILLGKILMQIIITLIPAWILASVFGVFFGVSVGAILLMLLVIASAVCFMAAYGLFINLLMPKFNWISVAAVAKQSGSVAVTLLSSMFVGFLLTGGGVVSALFGFSTLYMILETLIFGGAFAGLLVYLAHGGTRRFLHLSEVQA